MQSLLSFSSLSFAWHRVLALLFLLTPSLALATPWQPVPLTPDERKAFYGSPEDTLHKPTCTGRARVTAKCRDKDHYVASNEYNHQMFRPFIEGIGGGHVGVGTEQNFTFVAWARSRFVWMMDYDPVVVRVNLVHRALIMMSKTSHQYVQRFSAGEKRIEAVAARIRRFYKDRPDVEEIIEAFRYARKRIGWQNHLYLKRRWNWHYQLNRPRTKEEQFPFKDDRDFAWLHNEAWYQYIRKMFQHDRIRIMKGDLLANKSLFGIGESAKKLGVPVRSFYPSNAEEFWKLSPQYRQNIRNLPMDKKSVIIRTRFTDKYGPRLDSWIYFIQSGLDFQERLTDPKVIRIDHAMKQPKKIFYGTYTVGSPKAYLPIAP